MKSTFDKLNLRPMERRIVVGLGIVLFLVVQFIYVWPHFGEVAKMDQRREVAQQKLKTYTEEIAQTNKFAKELTKLEGEGLSVPPEDQSTELTRTIVSQSGRSRVAIQSTSRPNTRTNEFFLEQAVQITATATEGDLIDFLYDLGSGNSLIRVRDLTLRPDPSRTRLSASVKLVASYQKKPVARTVAPAKTAAPAAKAPAPPAPGPAAPKTSTPTRK